MKSQYLLFVDVPPKGGVLETMAEETISSINSFVGYSKTFILFLLAVSLFSLLIRGK